MVCKIQKERRIKVRKYWEKMKRLKKKRKRKRKRRKSEKITKN